jgi:Bacterial regulatory proteins, gntR family
MSNRRPEPGSAWGRCCPRKIPADWCDGPLPTGFTFATEREEQLIFGNITEDEFLSRNPQQEPPKANNDKESQPERKQKRSPAIAKLLGYRSFYDGLPTAPPLSPLAIAIWNWLWTCAKKKLVLTSERQLEKRFNRTRMTIRKSLRELEQSGMLTICRTVQRTTFWSSCGLRIGGE